MDWYLNEGRCFGFTDTGSLEMIDLNSFSAQRPFCSTSSTKTKVAPTNGSR